jgi:hypothetical protein
MPLRLPVAWRSCDRADAPFPPQRSAIRHWGGKAVEIGS